MIGHLTGKIIQKKPTLLLLDVNGVGYRVNISINTFDKLGDVEQEVSLFTYLHVREGALELFGFFTLPEKEMFELLISISGIGPKLARSLLSGIQTQDLKEAIRLGNVSRIIAVPGIGRKTAERLVVELRDKVESVGESAEISGGAFSIKSDAIAALTNLGYNYKSAEKAVIQIANANPGIIIEDLIKESLLLLNR